MFIGFKNARLKKRCTQEKEALGFLPGDIKPKKLAMQLRALAAFANLGEIPFRRPPLDFHPLRGSYAGMFAVKLNAKWRIIFKPFGTYQKNADQTPVLETVTAIEIQDVKDYHKGK